MNNNTNSSSSNERSVIAKLMNYGETVSTLEERECDHSSAMLPCPQVYRASQEVSYVTSSSAYAQDMSPPNDSLHDDCTQGKRKSTPMPYEHKDDAYWERRRRNNESAKRSREIRRIREMQTTKRIVFLEQQNVKLEAEVTFLREELERMRQTEFLPFLIRNSIKS